MGWLLNPIKKWWKTWQGPRLLKRLENAIEVAIVSGSLRFFLRLLSWMMSLAFKLDKNFRKSIAEFKLRLQFMSVDKDQGTQVQIAAVFNGKHMQVSNKAISDADAKVVFQGNKALINYLIQRLGAYFTGRPPDIAKLLLKHKVTIEGNLNYVMRFLYIINYLRLPLIRRLPKR